MKAQLEETANSAKLLRLELELLRRELDASQKRMEQMEGIYAHVADAIVVAELDGQIIDVNPAACSLLGYSKEELLALHPWDFVTNATREGLLHQVANLLLETPVLVQRECRRKSGERIWVENMMTRVNSNGRALVVISSRDVTQQKQAEDALRVAEKLARGLVAVRTDVAVALSRPGHVKAMLHGCTEAIVCHLDAAFARIWTLNKNGKVLELQASAGLYTRLDGSYSRIEIGKLKVGLIAGEKRPHLTNDVLNDARVSDREWARACGFVSFAGYPLIVEGRVVGVMALFARHLLSEATLETLASVADAIAQGIERKRVEEALQQSERELRLAFDAIPTLAWSALPNGLVEFLNRQWHEFTGISPSDGVLEGWKASFHPDDLEKVVNKLEEILVSVRPGEIEARMRRFDGEFRFFLIRATPLCDDTGNVIRWYGTNTDIEDLKHAEDELRRSEAFLAQAQRLTLTGSIWWKVATGEIIWSEESFRLMEYSGSVTPTVELILQRCHPDDLALVRATIARSAQNGTGMDLEHRLLMPDGSVKHVRVVLQNIRPDPGQFEFLGAVTDITAQQNAKVALEQALAKAKQSAAYLVEAQRLSHTGSFSWNASSGKIFWSDEMFHIYGLAQSTELTGETVQQRIHPDDRIRLLNYCQQCVRAGNGWEAEYRLLMPDGSVKHLREITHAEINATGELEYFGALMDVTASQKAQERLRQSQANLAHISRVTTMGELAASIAHEVNQPLAAVVTNANACVRWLEREPPNLQEACEAVRRIVRDGNRGSEVIARIRSLLKKVQPTKQSLDINDAIREVLALTEPNFQGATLRLDLASELPPVFGDRVQLQQVLLNLIMNAMDAMKPVKDRPRVLRIHTQTHGEREALVAVEDSGVGLNPQQMARLFEAFYTTKPEGLGLGLSIGRSLVEEHGGRLWVESNEGHGVTFQFTVPFKDGGAA